MFRLRQFTGRHSRAIAGLSLLVWCTVVFLLSAQPHLRIADAQLLDVILRKCAHLATYATMAVLASMTFAQEGTRRARWSLGATVWCVIFAATDEWHQSFVSGRHGTPIDVAIDTFGAVVGQLALRRRFHRSDG